MVEVNRITTPANMRWKLVDRSTGAENAAIDWRFRVGDQVKIRLVNEMDSGPSDAPSLPHPRGRSLPHPCPRRRARTEPGLEGHGARPNWRDGGHPPRCHEPRTLDGALSHRRAPRKRDDVWESAASDLGAGGMDDRRSTASSQETGRSRRKTPCFWPRSISGSSWSSIGR